MTQGVLEAAGGLGLFLLGMFVMTDGLRQLAGRTLRSALRRFTRSPTSGAAAGAIATAIIQSSSATTITAVGFVGAGLLTFAQALGIIFGANVGTTITGWLVALFGFKVPLGTIAFPIVLMGSLMRVFGRGRWKAIGAAVAGFGVIFVGIELLQSGLAGLEGDVTPDSFPPNTWFGRVQLVGIGVLITLVTQSSSAGVAIALASVNVGTITFPQAAAIVIGMDIGTTVTAAMATIGGGTQVRRTGLAHVVYNLLTGVAAFFLLVPYVELWERYSANTIENQPELLLVGFHTLFNGLGLIAVLPIADRFARLIERIVPAPSDDPTHRLGRSLLSDSDAALDVVEHTLSELADRCLSCMVNLWRTGRVDTDEIAELEAAVSETRAYVIEIRSRDGEMKIRARHQAAFHLADHLERVLSRLRRSGSVSEARTHPDIRRVGEPVIEQAEATIAWIRGDAEPSVDAAERLADELVARVRPFRSELIERSVRRSIDPVEVEPLLDSVRWLARMAVHTWRIGHYITELAEPSQESATAEPELDI